MGCGVRLHRLARPGTLGSNHRWDGHDRSRGHGRTIRTERFGSGQRSLPTVVNRPYRQRARPGAVALGSRRPVIQERLVPSHEPGAAQLQRISLVARSTVVHSGAVHPPWARRSTAFTRSAFDRTRSSSMAMLAQPRWERAPRVAKVQPVRVACLCVGGWAWVEQEAVWAWQFQASTRRFAPRCGWA